MEVVPLGIIFALLSLVFWGLGDFCIQRTTRVIGSVKALFFIGIAGSIGLLPFIAGELPDLPFEALALLLLTSVIILFGALFDFEALRQGKIAIVEPIIGLELPITIGLSVTLGRELITAPQYLLMGLVFVGIILAMTVHIPHLHYHRRLLEKGAILAGVGAIGMGLTNFMVGVSSQELSPLLTVWFAHSFLVLACGAYLLYRRELVSLIRDFRKHPTLIACQSIFDNAAWITYGYATTHLPIAIAMTISESYIVFAVLLGLLVGHEKIRRHQIVGIVFATIGVVALAFISPSH